MKGETYRLYINQLFRFFEEMNVNTFLISETNQDPKIYSPTGVEEFLTDGIIVLYNTRSGNVREHGLEDRINKMNTRLEEVAEKMDELMFLYQSNSRGKTSPSVRKMRVKEMITMLIQLHGSLNAPQLSELLKLSRTGCSEYLREIELRGVLESELKCRKKFYKIRQ